MKIKPTAILAFFGVLICFNASANDCAEHARNAMEISYCQVKASKYGSGLPSLHRFRKNSEQTQRLILKKPAQRAGVKLPPETTPPSAKPPSIEQSMPQAEAKKLLKPSLNSAYNKPVNSSLNHLATVTSPQASPQTKQPISQAKASKALDNCRLQQEHIYCEQGIFNLLKNRHNSQLEPGVLESHHRLSFPERQHPNYQDDNDSQFLSSLYPIYLNKMLDIGLAGATMSYTKFVATYRLHLSNNINPHERFATMYELLKKERKTNSVKERYSNELPQSIEQCMPVGTSLIVCDNVQTNWIFKK